MEQKKFKTLPEFIIEQVAKAKDEGRKMSPLAELIYEKYVKKVKEE